MYIFCAVCVNDEGICGVVAGMSNTAGTVAAIVSTMGVGVFIECLGSFQSFLSLTSIMYIGCTVFWVMNASGKCIFN
jgi:ACS family sodium-dependent inorganic phosphate cotransporter